MKKLNALSLKVAVGIAVLACGGWSLPDLGWGNIVQAPQLETKKIFEEEEEVDNFTWLSVEEQESDSTDADGGRFYGICTMVNNGINDLVDAAVYAKEWTTGELRARWTPQLVLTLQMMSTSDENVENKVSTIKHQLEQGADVNAVMPNGKSALRFVTELAVDDEKFVPLIQLFVDHGANPYLQEAVTQGSERDVESASTYVHEVGTETSALHVAIEGKCLRCVEHLVDAVVHPRSWLRKCTRDVCELVWDQSVLSIENDDAMTPLQMLVREQEGIDLQMLKLLVDHKESLASWDKEEALLQAFLLGNQKAVNMLSSAGVANWAAILDSVQQNVNRTWLPWLHNLLTGYYNKKKIEASAMGKLYRLLEFVQDGVLNPATTDSKTGNNLLHELMQYRAKGSWYEVTRVLFEQNKLFSEEIVNAKNRAGRTVLGAAVFGGDIKCVDQLLKLVGDRYISSAQISGIQSELIRDSNRFSLFNNTRSNMQQFLENELERRRDELTKRYNELVERYQLSYKAL